MYTSEQQKIVDVIVNQLGVGRELIVPEANLVDHLGADSLDIVELTMALEEAFDTEIPDDAAEKIRTVQDLFDYAEKHGFEVAA